MKNKGRTRRILLVGALLVGVSMAAWAQKVSLKVTGKVTDSMDEPIIGANVIEEGTVSNGTITDVDGNFVLNVAANATLKVTYIGYSTQQVSVRGRNTLVISLKEDTEMLDEVVVVGYGSMRKRDLTGAVGLVDGDVLSERHTTTLSSALQGAVSGVQVTRNGGAPESAPTIRIRGITTLSTNDPLIIIDGTPGNIDDVNTEDVESMTVLKDAASASIYGSRAAAGVILITTKRAKSNDLKMSYNFELGLDYIPVHPRTVGPERLMEMLNEERYNDNPSGGMYQRYAEDLIKNYRQLNKENPDKYPIEENWYRRVFNSVGLKHSHTFNISSGSKFAKTNATLSYDKVNAMYDNRDYERIMARVNNTFTINKYIGADLDFNFKHDVTNKPYADNSIYERSYTQWPIYSAYYSDGRISSGTPQGDNPVAYIYKGGSRANSNTTVGGRASLYITPLDGLKVSGIVAPRYVFTKEKIFKKAIPYTHYDDPYTIAGYANGFFTSDLDENRNDFYDITAQFIANYMKRFGKHDINVMGGYEGYYTNYEYINAGRDQYVLTDYPYLDMGPTTYRDNWGQATEQAYRSWFGRIAYGYANRYLVQANIRYDASSRFHKDHRWGNFPSFSGGWVISEEPFMKKAGINWLSYLKLRGSWGILGNERIAGNYYPYQAAINLNTTLFYQNGQATSFQSAAQNAYAVQDLTWEKTASTDIGVDINFFDNRLRFTAEWYKKKTSDMLLAVEIPGYMGLNNPQRNVGKMETKGFELDLGWSDRIGELRYSVSVNLSDAVSKMTDLGGTQFLGNKVKMQGSEYDEWYGYVSDGLFLTQEDLDNSPKIDNTQSIGSVKYKDISGPDGVPDGKISSEYDRVLLGGSQPRYLYGGNISLAYKNVDLSMAFEGVGKRLAQMEDLMWENMSIFDGHYWSSFNTDEQNAAAIFPRIASTSRTSDHYLSDFWLFDGRYLRMKNITVGWSLPKAWAEKILLKSARVYVAGNDLFCVSNYPKGWDPEVPVYGRVLPVTSSVIFGLSVNF